MASGKWTKVSNHIWRIRKELESLGVSAATVKEAVIRAKKSAEAKPLQTLPRMKVTQIARLLSEPGSKVIVTRTKNGVRVFTEAGYKALVVNAAIARKVHASNIASAKEAPKP